ncbi:hypothetical protein AB0D59_35810 [Streptomyces sp. NPDC048417]|uniref:hypothetical protein n=1 Tax=Streptomyces sp. NPDC048417 TaxID=3155387 RepID=UPI00342F4153
MTTAEDLRSAIARVALRCTRAAVITLVATFAVLVHHETAAPMTHIPPSHAAEAADMAGMSHGPAPSTQVRSDTHTAPPGTATPVVLGDDGFCSGMAMQHCSTAGVDTVKLVPPAEPAVGHTPAALSRAGAGRHGPGTTGRAPPDLTLLSRLLL